MLKEEYKELMDPISPSSELTEKTIRKMKEHPKAAKKQKRSLRSKRGWIPVIAAALVAVTVLTLVLFRPFGAHSFSILARAADTVSELSDKEFVTVAQMTGAPGGSLFLNFSGLYGEEEEILDENGRLKDLPDDAYMLLGAYYNLDIAGENVKQVRVSLNNGKFMVPDDLSSKLTAFDDRTESYYGAEEGVFVEGGQSFYSALSYDSADPIKGSAGFMDSEGDGVMWFVRHDYRESTDRELLEKLMSLSSMNGGFSGDKLEDKDLFIKVNEDYYNEMFRDVVMTVEVTFNNGAVSKKEIRFTAECSVDGYQTVNRLKSTSPDTFEEVTLYNYTITLKAKID